MFVPGGAASATALLAIGEHALVDFEHHRQDRGDEEHLALVAILGAEIARDAIDLDRGNRLAQPHVVQGIGDVAKEPRQFVGGARADRPQLDLPANGIAGRRETAVAERNFAAEEMRPVVGFAHFMAHEGERRGLGVHDDERRLLLGRGARRTDRCERQVRRDVDVGQGLAEPDTGGGHGSPGCRKSITAPAFDRGPE